MDHLQNKNVQKHIGIPGLSVIFCFITFLSTSQHLDKPDPEPEQIFAHVDKPFYTNGEVIWYKVYFLNKEEVQSKVLHVDIVSPDGNILITQKLKIEGNNAFGDINIPLDWEEGVYLFRCYTKWNLNFNSRFSFSKQIPIYNALRDGIIPDELAIPDAKLVSIAELTENNEKVKLELNTNRPVYSKGEEVKLTIEVNDLNGQPVKASLSLSIIDLDLIPDPETFTVVDQRLEYQALTPDLTSPTRQFDFEKNLTINGNILDPITLKPVSSTLLSGYLVKKRSFLLGKCFHGKTQLELPDFYGVEDFQIHNLNTYQNPTPLLKLNDLSEHLPSYSELSDREIHKSPAIERYLYLSKLRRKFYEIFDLNQEHPSIDEQPVEKLFIPDKTYFAKDFHLLKNLEEFIDEVIVMAQFKKEGANRTVRLFNIQTKYHFIDKPWYMINGFLTPDEISILKIPFKDLDRVEIYVKNSSIIEQFEPFMIRNGVIAVYTKVGKTRPYIENAPNLLEIEGFYFPQKFEIPDYSKENRGDQIPDFRPLLLWDPNILVEDNDPAFISFPTSDAISTFLITVQGVTASGIPLSVRKLFRVQR